MSNDLKETDPNDCGRAASDIPLSYVPKTPPDPNARWKWTYKDVTGTDIVERHNAAIDAAAEATAATINEATAKSRVADYKDVEQLRFEIREKEQRIHQLEAANNELFLIKQKVVIANRELMAKINEKGHH